MCAFVKTPPLELGPFVFADLRLCLAVVCLCVWRQGRGGGGEQHSVMSDFATPWTITHQAPLSLVYLFYNFV